VSDVGEIVVTKDEHQAGLYPANWTGQIKSMGWIMVRRGPVCLSLHLYEVLCRHVIHTGKN